MSLEVVSNKENQLLKDGQVTGYKCKNFNFVARGHKEGGQIVITADQGQTSEKRIDIELITGKIIIKSLGIQAMAK